MRYGGATETIYHPESKAKTKLENRLIDHLYRPALYCRYGDIGKQIFNQWPNCVVKVGMAQLAQSTEHGPPPTNEQNVEIGTLHDDPVRRLSEMTSRCLDCHV